MSGWIITHDRLAEPDLPSRVGVGAGEVNEAGARRFRLLDDDGVVYYEGLVDYEGPDGANPLTAALFFGAFDARAVEAQELVLGRWETVVAL